MNRNEISTLLKFVSKTRILFNKTVSNQTIDADWRIFSYVISNHLENKLCTTTSIIQVSGLPFATGLRKVNKLIKENQTGLEKFILNIMVFHIKPPSNVETRDKCTTAQIFDGSD